MVNTSINILVVEDNAGDFFLVKEYLQESFPLSNVFHADTLQSAFSTLDNNDIDVILLDLTLPDDSGISTFRHVHAKVEQIPIIVLTGMGDTDLALETV